MSSTSFVPYKGMLEPSNSVALLRKRLPLLTNLLTDSGTKEPNQFEGTQMPANFSAKSFIPLLPKYVDSIAGARKLRIESKGPDIPRNQDLIKPNRIQPQQTNLLALNQCRSIPSHRFNPQDVDCGTINWRNLQLHRVPHESNQTSIGVVAPQVIPIFPVKYSYKQLIFMAIESSPAKMLTVKSIYQWFDQNVAFSSRKSVDSRNSSIRHTLSTHKCFRLHKVYNQTSERGSYWVFDPKEGEEMLESINKTIEAAIPKSYGSIQTPIFVTCAPIQSLSTQSDEHFDQQSEGDVREKDDLGITTIISSENSAILPLQITSTLMMGTSSAECLDESMKRSSFKGAVGEKWSKADECNHGCAVRSWVSDSQISLLNVESEVVVEAKGKSNRKESLSSIIQEECAVCHGNSSTLCGICSFSSERDAKDSQADKCSCVAIAAPSQDHVYCRGQTYICTSSNREDEPDSCFKEEGNVEGESSGIVEEKKTDESEARWRFRRAGRKGGRRCVGIGVKRKTGRHEGTIRRKRVKVGDPIEDEKEFKSEPVLDGNQSEPSE